MKKNVFELIDIIQHTRPHIGRFDVEETADMILKDRGGRAHRSYSPVFSRVMKPITSGMAELSRLKAEFGDPEEDKWNGACHSLVDLLYRVFGGEASKWYDTGRKPIEVVPGAWFKPAIRGVWANSKGVHAVLVNPRKGLYFGDLDMQFLNRGIYELHVRDEPSLTGGLIVDMGQNPHTEVRRARVKYSHEIGMMSEERFDEILTNFMAAVELAGMASVPKDGKRMSDLFRRR